MITRSGVPMAKIAARLEAAPPTRNSSNNRHGPRMRSAGNPKISKNIRLPSRCDQSACRNSAVNRRSTLPSRKVAHQSPRLETPLESAPQSSHSVLRASPGRLIDHR